MTLGRKQRQRTRKLLIALTLLSAGFGSALINSSFLVLRAEQSAEPSRSVWSAVYTEAQAKRGEAVYESQCTHCHGPTLGGDGTVPPLIGEMFMTGWDGLTLADLFERIRISMPADNPGTIGDQPNADVIAYMLKVGAFPAGENELPMKPESLKQILMTAKKPAEP